MPDRETKRVIDAISGVLCSILPSQRPVGLHEPTLGDHEIATVSRCIETGFVSSVGTFVSEFELRFAKRVGAEHAIAVSSGTAALEVALGLAGVKAGDEVLMPALTFVGTANAAAHCGGIPHFVDSSPTTLGMCATALRDELERCAELVDGTVRNRFTGARLAAIVPVHVFGHLADITDIANLGNEYSIPVVEDAAEALGTAAEGRHAGTFGLMGTFSFNGNKIITTGGGGMIVTDNAELAASARHITTTAKTPHPWRFNHDAVAWNYRLPNINAALGCAQLDRLDDFLAAKRRLAFAYESAFEQVMDVQFVNEPRGTTSNYWLCTATVSPDIDLDAVLEELNAVGLGCRPAWTLMSDLPMYASNPRGTLATASALSASIINLPSSAHLDPAGEIRP